MKNALFVFAVLTGIIISIGNIVIVAQTDMKPPVAKKEPKVTKIHGYEIEDDYAWLRDRNDKKDPEIIKYLEAENAYTESLYEAAPGVCRTIFTRKCSDASSRRI